MPTPRKVYSINELRRMTSEAENIVEAYQNRPDIAVEVQVRYDPNLPSVATDKSAFFRHTENNFFLIKEHYRYLLFAFRYFGWIRIEEELVPAPQPRRRGRPPKPQIKYREVSEDEYMSYEDFLAILQRPFAEGRLELGVPSIITLQVNRDWVVDAHAQYTEHCNNLFEGSIHAPPYPKVYGKENSTKMALRLMAKISEGVTPVFIDSQKTPKCEHISFRTSFRHFHNQALERFRERHASFRQRFSQTRFYLESLESDVDDDGEENDDDDDGDNDEGGDENDGQEHTYEWPPAPYEQDDQPSVRLELGEILNRQESQYDPELGFDPAIIPDPLPLNHPSDPFSNNDISELLSIPDTPRNANDSPVVVDAVNSPAIDFPMETDLGTDMRSPLFEQYPERIPMEPVPEWESEPEDDDDFEDSYDVLMWNPLFELLCTTECAIAVNAGNGKWITPHIASGAPWSPLRQLLLELGVLEEYQIPLDAVRPGDEILLLDDARGVQRGILVGELPAVSSKKKRTRKQKKKPFGFQPPKRPTRPERVAMAIAAEKTSESLQPSHAPGGSEHGIPGTFSFRI